MLFLHLLFFLSSSSKVFFVPHSHIDVGWINVANYYYTEHCSKILSTVIELLEEDPRRKFAWSESYWISEYIKEHPDSKGRLKNLIDSGQIEIVGGGWVQHDEALTDFESIAKQFEHGHSFLQEEFNISSPTVAWQLDPFGHSSLTPAILEKFGFKNLVMGRIDASYKSQLIQNGDMEFLWKSYAFGSHTGIFTHVLYNHYSLPEFLDMRQYSRCFRSLDKLEKDIHLCLLSLSIYVEIVKTAYRTENIMILYGDDLFFKDIDIARQQFKLIELMRDLSIDIDIKIATPSEYFESVLEEQKRFSVFEGDFLPYISEHLRQRPIAWTGFYSSRPELKRQAYEVQSLSRSAEILSTLVLHEKLDTKQVSVLLHHDAITGTCHPKTSEDYQLRLQYDKNISLSILNKAFSSLITCRQQQFSLQVPYKVFILFNSLSWKISKIFNFPILSSTVKLSNSLGSCIKSQTIQINGRLEVLAELKLEAFSFSTVFISQVAFKCECCSYESEIHENEQVNNEFLEIRFLFGFIESISIDENVMLVDSILMRYDGTEGGAYEFRPRNKPKGVADLINFSVQSGPLCHFIQSSFNCSGDPCTQSLLLPQSSPSLTLKFSLKARVGSELFLRFHNPQKKLDSVYTFNSADIIKRSRFEKRKNCYGENGYPIVGAFIVDYGFTHLKIFPKFPLGVQLGPTDYFELHLHRNPPNDDMLGLGNPLEDNQRVEHEFFINFGSLNATDIWKSYLNHKNSPLVLAFANKTLLSSDLDSGELRNDDWDLDTEYRVAASHDCCYLSRVFYKNFDVYANVLNICEKGQKFYLNGSGIVQEVLMNGNDLNGELDGVLGDGYIKFEINRNSRESLVRYYKEKGKRADREIMPPWSLKTFRILHETASLHTVEGAEEERGEVEIVVGKSNLVAMGYLFVWLISMITVALLLSFIIPRNS